MSLKGRQNVSATLTVTSIEYWTVDWVPGGNHFSRTTLNGRRWGLLGITARESLILS